MSVGILTVQTKLRLLSLYVCSNETRGTTYDTIYKVDKMSYRLFISGIFIYVVILLLFLNYLGRGRILQEI